MVIALRLRPPELDRRGLGWQPADLRPAYLRRSQDRSGDGEIIWRLNGSQTISRWGGHAVRWPTRECKGTAPDPFDNAESNQDLDGTVASRRMVLDLDERR